MCNFYFYYYYYEPISPRAKKQKAARSVALVAYILGVAAAAGARVRGGAYYIRVMPAHLQRPSKALTEPGAWAWAPNKLRVSTLLDRAIRLLVHVLVRACVIYWAIDLDYIEVGSGPARRYPVALPLPLPLSVTSLLKFASASAHGDF